MVSGLLKYNKIFQLEVTKIMRWILAFHIIFIVAWFAGLFYLPRLFVYHTLSNERLSLDSQSDPTDQFKVMEAKLLYYIMTPAAILATWFGLWLLVPDWEFYRTQGWMLANLAF